MSPKQVPLPLDEDPAHGIGTTHDDAGATYLVDDAHCAACRCCPCRCDALYEDGVERRRNKS